MADYYTYYNINMIVFKKLVVFSVKLLKYIL